MSKKSAQEVESSTDFLQVEEDELDDDLEYCLDWKAQLTIRSVITGVAIGAIFCFIVLKLALGKGVIPSLNIGAGLVGFAALKGITMVVKSMAPFTKQENTVVQTVAVACYGVSFILGFSSYMLAMTPQSYETVGVNAPGNLAGQVQELYYGTMLPYALCVCFSGALILIIARKSLIIDMRLLFPSGTATGVMIESFFTKAGAKIAENQFKIFTYVFLISFFFAGFKWLFTGGGCDGFYGWPLFGFWMAAKGFVFTWEMNYVGCGMLVPYSVSISMITGAVVSWMILWPWIETKDGIWWSADIEGNDLRSLYGFKVFGSIALILGDGLYSTVMMIYIGTTEYLKQKRRKNSVHGDTNDDLAMEENGDKDLAKRKQDMRDKVFLSDNIPWYFAVGGYSFFVILGCIAIPFLFHSVEWYECLIAYALVPFFAIPNAYICGLTDWDMASTFGKLVIFLTAALAHAVNPEAGIIAGLATCGIVFCGTSAAATLMTDFRTAYITMASPKAMVIAQLLGAFSGCFIAPGVFALFDNAFPIGDPNGQYPAPYGPVYRSMAIVGTQGVDVLPENCGTFCIILFCLAIACSALRDAFPKFVKNKTACFIVDLLVPIPAAFSLPFYIGADLSVIMATGSVIRLVWNLIDRSGSSWTLYGVVVASAIIAGDGIWVLPDSAFSLAAIEPPFCMQVSAP